ncbi:MAG: PAS domain S-box protein [Candidatus Rokubacteria bacterium]|nr:PAS domain S-box protein [Candidatus Rokubacteria bacterium]
MRLRTQLSALVVSALVPVALFAGLLALLYSRDRQTEVNRDLFSTARSLSRALDLEFEAHIRALEVLATSHYLDVGALRGFRLEADRAIAMSPAWEAIVLVDPGGQQLVNTRVAPGTPLPRTGLAALVARTIATQRPGVSDLFIGPVAKRPVIALAVPVVRDGAVRFVLTSSTSPERVRALLADQRIPADFVATIVDGGAVIVARSLAPEQFVGGRVSGPLAARLAGSDETLWDGRTLEGEDVRAAVRRSGVSGWAVVVTVPSAVVQAPVSRALGYLSLAGLVVVLGGLGLAIVVGRRIAAPITALADAAGALGRGEPVQRPPSSIVEVERVARALEAASAERGRAEASLRANERFYRSLLENALDMVTVVDAQGVVVYESAAITRVLGWTPAERVGRPHGELVHPDDVAVAADGIARGFRAAGVAQTFRFRARHRDGTWRDMHSVGQVFVDEAGVVIGVVNSRDVTGQRRAEEELALQSRALDAAANGIVITDRDGRIVWVNEAFTRMTGYPAADAVGQTPRLLKSGRHEHTFYTRLWDTVVSGVPWRGELVNRRRDGSLYTEEQVITPVRAAGGQITHFIAVKQDVTDRKRVDEELRQQREVLYQSEKLAGMGQLLAGVAHELNNPLTVVIGRATMLGRALAGGPLEPSVRKLAEAAERCSRIVKNFVALARQRPPTRQKVALNQVVREALELVAYPLRVDDVEVTLDLAPDLAPIWGDAHQLHQVVVNLLTNAHQAVRETLPPRRVALTTRADAARGRLRLEVSDTGRGIPPEIRPRVFEPFFTTKPVGQGTGLGLSICQGIVEGHGGTISVADGTPGATFVVELPAGEGAEARAEPEPVEPAPPARRGIVLVVDDEAEVGGLLAELIAADGHEVDTASDGLDALDKLGRRAYDLVLSDVKMPNLDGRGLYREVERRFPHLAARMVFLTGDALGAEVSAFIETTGRLNLGKPFDPDEVRRLVNRMLATL